MEIVAGRMEDGKEVLAKQEAGFVEVPSEATPDESSRIVGEDHDVSGEEPEHEEHPDYSTFSKKDFVELLKTLATDNDFRKVEFILREVKPLYDELREKEKEEALKVFVESGGNADDFEYRQSDLDSSFDANFRLIRDRRNQFHKSQEDQKNENLRRKNELLEQLRVLTDAEDSDQSFNTFKEIQKNWKNVGPVPNTQIKPLWASYTALVDRFYDNRSIYFELKELDRKKNLESKVELCVRAEKLMEVEKLKDAVRELNELHNEFKHIGPVPKDEKDAVWQRFKAASDAIYAKRDAFLDQINKEQVKNLDEKLRIAEEVAAFASFETDRIKEWNQKTQEILAIQKKWEGIGAVTRSKAKEVNKKFWSAFKAFFSKKNVFFRKLDEEREKNLQAKKDIIRQAHELKESKDWDKTANALKDLQKRWKDLGPVPEKMREKVFQEFKEACDFFFGQRRNEFDKLEGEQEVNLQQKDALCLELETLTSNKAGTPDQLQDIVERFNALGFVPKKSINDSKNRFKTAVDQFIAKLDLPADEKDRLTLEVTLGNLRNDPQGERKLYQREQTIRKRISKIENDIATLKNNMEFFGRSKNAEAYKAEFAQQIDAATVQLTALKGQLKLLKTVG
ncbi:MAG TPA: DUF349 domain-containing protein [Cyclobacteriaceae bacterium]|nr:DUF349 domain-containing protein [Cyclobacteriaceae bacterium]